MWYIKIENIKKLLFSIIANIIIILFTLSSIQLSFKIVGYCLSLIFIVYMNRDVIKPLSNIIKSEL